MATTASVCSLASAFLLLAGPALAQSQGGTGVGATLEQAGAGLAEAQAAFDEYWEGEPGRWAKYGIGAAGIAAALLTAGDAVAGESAQGTLSFDEDGNGLLSFGAKAPVATDVPAQPGAGTGTTTSTR